MSDPTPPRKHPWKRWFLIGTASKILFSVLTLLLITHHFAPGPYDEPTTVYIPRGTGFFEIADTLYYEGAIRSKWLFEGVALMTFQARSLKAGEYEFPAGASPYEIVKQMSAGKVITRKVTLREGITTAEALELVKNEPALTGEITLQPKEGELLPETYHFTRGDTRDGMITRMQKDMGATLLALWEKRAQGLPVNSPGEALTLASIVEKETGVDGERGRVAAVFVNRLRKGMKLESDPTTVYALELTLGRKLGRALLIKDLATESPYNTYYAVGLPPGPICNPGKAAIVAVLNPPATDEYYFVATGTGGHHFARTFKEHQNNITKYRAVRRNNSQ